MQRQISTTLTGVKVGHSTQHRLVQTKEWSLAQVKQAISEVSSDGGKVRRRGGKGQETYWQDYKAVACKAYIMEAFSKTIYL